MLRQALVQLRVTLLRLQPLELDTCFLLIQLLHQIVDMLDTLLLLIR
jgi:hypothetical protein